MLFDAYYLTDKQRELAEEFNEKNKNFVEDTKKVYVNLQKLLSRKQASITQINSSIALLKGAYNPEEIKRFRAYLESSVENLERLLGIEESYLIIVFKKSISFKEQANKIKKNCKIIYPRPLAEAAGLSAKYLTQLLTICEQMKEMLEKSIKINSKQLRYTKKCKRKIIKNKFPLNFVAVFYKLQEEIINERIANNLLIELEEAQREMKKIQSRLIDSFNANKKTLKWTVGTAALGIYLLGTKNPFQDLVGIYFSLYGFLLINYIKITRPKLKTKNRI